METPSQRRSRRRRRRRRCPARPSPLPLHLTVAGVQAGSELLRAAERGGLPTASEVFADRAYTADGNLAPRALPGAVIHDAQQAAE